MPRISPSSSGLALRLARGAQRLGGATFQRVQQRGDRQLPLAVDADVDQVLAVELEVQPGAAIRDHPRGEQVFAGRVRLALVVVEEHAGRAVHLRLTMTRSVPLMMNVPLSVISGMSPM